MGWGIAASIAGSLLSSKIQGGAAGAAGEAGAAGFAEGALTIKESEKKALHDLGSTYRQISRHLEPWVSTGEQAFQELFSIRGELTAPFTEETFRADPGYQFRLEEGERGLTNYLARQGLRDSGEARREFMRINQGYADQTYNDAFNRHWQENTNRFNVGNALAGYGERAIGRLANASQARGSGRAGVRMQAANAIANMYAGRGQAQAQGIQNEGDAYAQGIAGATQNYLTGSFLNQGVPVQAPPRSPAPVPITPYTQFRGGAIPGRGVL